MTSHFKQILLDQQEELASFKQSKLIAREVLPRYRPYLRSALIKVIMGPRRCGKSTLALQLLEGKSFAYVNFDDERLAGLRAKDLNALLESLHEIHGSFRHALLDEIQNVEGWELFANRLQRAGLNLIITGSNAKLLSRDLATHLTGRHVALELYPFSFREFLAFHGAQASGPAATTRESARFKNFLTQYLETGGFPESYSEPYPRRYLTDLYQSILTKDIALRHGVRHVRTMQEISRYLLSHFACHMTHTKLKNIFSLNSVHTVKNYVSFLEESYLLFPLERFSFKLKEKITAPRKIYAIDTGLIQALSPLPSGNEGRFYENAAALELLRRKNAGADTGLTYWQNAAGEEVDFVVTKGRQAARLIQVCADPSHPDTRHRELKALAKAAEELRCKDLLVLTADYEALEQWKGRAIRFLPLWKWLLNLQ